MWYIRNRGGEYCPFVVSYPISYSAFVPFMIVFRSSFAQYDGGLEY